MQDGTFAETFVKMVPSPNFTHGDPQNWIKMLFLLKFDETLKTALLQAIRARNSWLEQFSKKLFWKMARSQLQFGSLGHCFM